MDLKHPAREDRSGTALLQNPFQNKDAAFTAAERRRYGLEGLLPPRITSIETQTARVMDQLDQKTSDLEKYIFLMALESRNKTLFYRVILDHIEKMLPIIYTPTVGEACLRYGHIFRRPRGLFISRKDRGRINEILENWPAEHVSVVVVTDGERILGLGDLGAQGMGIPVGKLALYTVCAGINPQTTLPVTLDVGTENEGLRRDPLYIGISESRLRGDAYYELLDEFMEAVDSRYGPTIIQFEDFAGHNAFRLLARYQDRYCTFNDDIQGTASVALAGLLGALRETGTALVDQRFLFLGAGGAGIGIADLITCALVEEGLAPAEARRRCWLVDSQGLIVSHRKGLSEDKARYAHEHEALPDLLSAVGDLRPTAIIGVSGQPGTFSGPVLEAMAGINRRPIVFALSNPTSKAECTAEEAYRWTAGRVIFASGSPFEPVEFEGKKYVPGQGNNAYVFPGMGLGLIASRAGRVTDAMFLAAAQALAEQASARDLSQGRVYPPLSRIREVSAAIAYAVAETAYRQGYAGQARPADLSQHIQALMYRPVYQEWA